MVRQAHHREMAVVYILQCTNGEYYVGSTTNLAMRLKEHASLRQAQNEQGSPQVKYKGAKFTKAHYPVELVYTEEYQTEHEARIRERQLHKWTHAKKEALIKGDIERLKCLSRAKSSGSKCRG